MPSLGSAGPLASYAAVLTIIGHRLEGSEAAEKVLRGPLLGLFAFAGFFGVLALTIERVGMTGGFAVSVAATLALA